MAIVGVSLMNIKRMTKLLKEAEVEHKKFEETLGKKDDNWSEWYARYIFTSLAKEDSSNVIDIGNTTIMGGNQGRA